MGLNRIQVQVFNAISREKDMEVDDYVSAFSMQYLGREIHSLEMLTEEDGDAWITKAYIESLG